MIPLSMMIGQLTAKPFITDPEEYAEPVEADDFVFTFDIPRPHGNARMAEWNNNRIAALIRQWPKAASEDGFTIGNVKRVIAVHCMTTKRAILEMVKAGEVIAIGLTRKGGEVYRYVGKGEQ